LASRGDFRAAIFSLRTGRWVEEFEGLDSFIIEVDGSLGLVVGYIGIDRIGFK
jgi:hypothetical protein